MSDDNLNAEYEIDAGCSQKLITGKPTSALNAEKDPEPYNP